jgi:hypothetical protein
MGERRKIVPFKPSDRPCSCPGFSGGTAGIFFKPSHFVTFRNLERRPDLAMSLVLKEECLVDVPGRAYDRHRN